MNYLNSITNNESNTVAGVPFMTEPNGRFAHLSVPIGLVCSERHFYDTHRNVHISETVCENQDFDRLARSAQHIPMTRKNKPRQAKKTKRYRPNKN
jgi:hypothetical protein